MNDEQRYDKIYACWLGKNIGGTLGAPVEGRCEFMDIKWFPELGESGMIPNDDLDLQLLNLHALEQYGPAVRSEHLSREWAEHCYFTVDEYGYALSNARRGFTTPLAGRYNNGFTDCMGSPIRSEIWAAVCMGKPELAAFFAWQDAVVDHAGGEGIYGEIFNTVLECLAYESTDRERLVEESLRYLPKTCRVYKAVKSTLEWYREGVSYADIRGKILDAYGTVQRCFTDAPQNIAFTVVALLYGENFEDGMLKAVNLGYDTDCTVATFASIYGILFGTQAIPKKWSDPIGDKIVLSPEVNGFCCPKDLDELTRRTLKLMHQFSYENPAEYKISEEDLTDYDVQQFTVPSGEKRESSLWITLKYDDNPSIRENGEKTLFFRIRNNTAVPWRMELKINCPCGFVSDAPVSVTVQPGKEYRYAPVVRAGQIKTPYARFALQVRRLHLSTGGIWTDYQTPFSLMRASRWIIGGEEKWIDGITVRFDKPDKNGEYVAETTLFCPEKRLTQLYVSAGPLVELWLDGEKRVESKKESLMRPSYTTAVPPDQNIETVIEAGLHSVKIRLQESQTAEKAFAFVVTAQKATALPYVRPLIGYDFLDNIIG